MKLKKTNNFTNDLLNKFFNKFILIKILNFK